MFLYSDTSIPHLACLAFSDSIFFFFAKFLGGVLEMHMNYHTSPTVFPGI